jgi:hypothetical protein
MNDRTSCASPEALVTYLYEECEPAERESIAAHVAICASCAEEVQALGDTRAHLASWSPPALPLGFQITRTETNQPARVLKPAAWWSRPLPAWAQVAAAVVIFAAGMSASAYRSTEVAPRASLSQPAAITTPVAANMVSRDDLARLDARLRSMVSAQTQRVAVQSPLNDGSPDHAALTERVNALEARLAENERTNMRFLTAVAAELNKTNLDITQRAAVMEEGQQELRDAFRSVGPALAVRTALTGGR